MKRVLFLFLDGVGLGSDDPAVNPLVAAAMPHLDRLLRGQKISASTGRYSTTNAALIPTDACLGIPKRPQSATGQATILTGINAAQRLGEHYGPRPDDRVRAVLNEGSIFARLAKNGQRGFFCNAYPQSYFDRVNRGKRRLSAVPYAAKVSGQQLLTYDDLCTGRGLASDFTNAGWRDHLGYPQVPVYTPEAGGRQLWQIAQRYHFLFFEHWQTDVFGHRQQRTEAIANFEVFDAFLGGLLSVATLENTLIIIGSDHGNVEDCSHGKHTTNPALTLLIGDTCHQYASQIHNLTDFVPVVQAYLAEEVPS